MVPHNGDMLIIAPSHMPLLRVSPESQNDAVWFHCFMKFYCKAKKNWCRLSTLYRGHGRICSYFQIYRTKLVSSFRKGIQMFGACNSGTMTTSSPPTVICQLTKDYVWHHVLHDCAERDLCHPPEQQSSTYSSLRLKGQAKWYGSEWKDTVDWLSLDIRLLNDS